MAGSKRRRAASKTSAAASTTAAAASSSTSSTTVLKTLERLKQIAESKSQETLQAFCDGKCWIDSATKKSSLPNWDTYWIVLGTHMLNRLIKTQDNYVVMSLFCDALSKILTSDKSKLEKASHSTSSRSILARAMLTATVASLMCVQNLVNQHTDAFQAAVASLDRLIHLKAEATKDETTRNVEWAKGEDLQELCGRIPSLEAEDACVTCLEDAEGTKESPPPVKRARTRRKGAAAAAAAASPPSSPAKVTYDTTLLHEALGTIMHDSNQRIDGRVAVKRWASMSLVWLCQGQVRLLQFVHELAGKATATKSSKSTQLPIDRVSHIINRLLLVASEAGHNCGLRPPTGGMDHYMRAIAASQPKKSKFVRVDIRDWATVCIDDLIKVHQRCLDDLSSKNVVNDREESDTPDVAGTLNSLCRAAATSVSNSTFSEQGEWTKMLLSIASAKCLQLNANPKVALDCKLTNFGLTHLEDCLRSLEQQGTITISSSSENDDDDDEEEVLDRLFSLGEPLATPEVPSSGSGSDEPSALHRRQCNFAGLLPSSSRSEFSNEKAVALALRALQPTKDSPGVKLVSTLTDIVRRVYDTRKPKEVAEPKKKAKSTSRRTKRRKVEEVVKEDDEKWCRVSPPRAHAANEALNALRHCLTTSSASMLRRSIRKSLSVEHFEELIQLSESMDKIILKTRSDPVKIDATESETPPANADIAFFTTSIASSSGNDTTHDFAHWEKLLWAAHIAMCQTLGRGKTSFDGNLLDMPLIPSADRKRIFKAIASSHKTDCGLDWPLILPAGYHAFLVANLTSEPISADAYEADLYIAKECVKSIHRVLMNPGILSRKRYNADELFLDDDVPFSHRDATTFLLAISRLPSVHQRKCLDDLVRSSLGAVMAMQHGEEREIFLKNAEASGFLARVLVVCGSLVDIINNGSSLRETFFTSAGPVILPLPAFTSNSEWYRCDRCFMGLFADWESPVLPELNRSSSGLISVKESTIGELQIVLETAFGLGFDTARNDHCHLLFAAWNGLGKIQPKAWRPLSLSSSSFPSYQVDGTNISKQILQMRDDVCLSQKDINEGAERTISSSRLKVNLSLMLRRAHSCLDSILDEHVSSDDEMSQEVPVALFSLLSALPCYVSSSIAAHTRPGNDYFSTTLSKNATRKSKRQRGYSSGSDPHSDADSVETDGGGYDSDVRVDVLSRLRECCDAFGAAPIHPDWLDVSCSLREGFTPNDAIESAECALATLNKLATVAFHQFKKHYLDAIKAYHKADESLNDRINLCLTLCQFSTHESAATSVLGPGPYPDDRDWKDDIANICSLNQDVLDLVLDEGVVSNVDQARESWCPNAAQRLVGKLQDRNRLIGGWETSTAELRAGGEWELLLSEALSVPCLDVKEISTENSDAKVDWDEESVQRGSESLRLAFLWRSVVFSATSHLMPAAALLRLGLNNKIGRKPHPFSFHENNQDPYDVAPLTFSERLSGSVTVPSSVKPVVYETLTFLSRLSAEGDDNLMTTCHAISAHLVIDTASFSDLEGLQNIRFAFMGLKRIRQLFSKSRKKGTPDVVPYIVERLAAVIEDFGRSPRNKISSTVESSEEFQRLLSYFGAPGIRRADCTVENSAELFDILTAKSIKELDEENFESYLWTKKSRQTEGITELVAALCANMLNANDRTRACLALLLSHLVDLESHPPVDTPKTGSSSIVLSAIVNSFNSVDVKLLKNLLLRDLCCVNQPTKQDATDAPGNQKATLRPDLATLLSYLLSSRGRVVKFKRSRLILDVLLDSFDSWSHLEYKDQEPVLDVLFLYGCRFNQLREIGTKLLDRATTPSEANQTVETDTVKAVSKFFAFIRALSSSLETPSKSKSRKAKGSSEASKNDKGGSGEISTQEVSTLNPRSCSFAQKSGFRAQHWYNCYTCQLVWDKGCCTLCAMVCHRGHDVSYSRFSSFFCDCGAEDGNVTEQTRVSCKCLSPLPADQVEKIFKNEEADNAPETQGDTNNSALESPNKEKETASNSIGVEIARISFRNEALASITGFKGNVKDSPWLDSLLTILRQQFQLWKSARSPKSGLELFSKESTKGDEQRPVVRVPHRFLRKNLRSRRAKVLDLQRMGEKSLVPVRAAKGFQVRMSSDTTSNAHLSGQLSRHDTTRSIIATDSRGRMIIAEPCALVFCSAIPAVSTRHVNRPYETPLSRHQMCILGTATIGFHIVGVQPCAENERHLVVWGKSEACVVVLKPNSTGVEETVDLVFDLDSHESDGDHLVKCEWIPGSQTHLAVGCSRFVRIYDITKSDSDKRALPVIGYNLGFEASLRDVAIVPYKEGGDSEEIVRPGTVSKMFLLLENGRLHVVDLKTASGGRLESPGDQHFEPSECIGLSTAGVRPRTGSSVGQPGASTRTLGEGSKLAYLKQSRVLLYKCLSSCVLALMLDSKGDVEGTFEFLPHTITSEVLGNGPENGYSISGPFTHWTELGVVYREGASFFRVACVGKSSKSNKPKLLCIEFNENDVRVREVVWLSGSSMGLGLSLSMSFEGLSAFSAPFVAGTSEQRVFGERVYMCASTSNGSLLFFGDETVDTAAQLAEDTISSKALQPVSIVNPSGIASMQAKRPFFPLTRFESLKNISESDAVVFGGEGTGSEPSDLKSRLSRDSSSSFLCPRREGCTLTISIKPDWSNSSGSKKNQTNDASLHQQVQTPPVDPVIAALRILVGSTSNYIPSKIHVQGRPVDLTPRVKKWYCLPLTDEEIALSLRNGFVTVGIGPSFDSSTSVVVDSIEVYATERKTIETWLPTGYYQRLASGQADLYTAAALQLSSTISSDSGNADSNALILSARALTNLCELVGASKIVAESERDFLRQLIQDTALDREKKVSECVHSLLESLQPDIRSRKSFYDESILFGCSRALKSSADIFDRDGSSSDSDEVVSGSQKFAAIRAVVQDCLEAASSIARERPMNYLQSMQSIAEREMSSGSIAVDAHRLIMEGLLQENHYEDLIGGLGGIVDLSLTEMAIELNTDAPHSKQFAKFDAIRGLLECDKPMVVERCCEAIAAFCRIHGGAERPPNDAPDLFTLLQHARFVAYQCDSCELCPMKDIRYTLLEDDYDIDLCKNCFRLGQEFAESQGFKPQVHVVINGKTVGGDTKLTCVQMRQMQPVSLEKMDIEQVEVKSSVRGSPEDSPEEDEELQKALRLSLGESASDENEVGDLPIGHQSYEYFVGHLFTSVVELLASVLKRDRCSSHVAPLIRLLLDLVRNSKQTDSKNDRARRFSKELSHGISHILKSASGGKLSQEKVHVLVTCLRSFTNLLVPDADSQYFLEGSQLDDQGDDSRVARARDKATPKYICETHNIPAVRRRCARGVHKDRRFYVCGKERGQRCKYFVWADAVESKPEKKPKVKSTFNDFIRGFLWSRSASSMPLHSRLCGLLEDEVLGDDPDCEVSLSLTTTAAEDKQTDSSTRKTLYEAKDMETDLADGVYCSREKLQDVLSGADMVKARVDGTRQLDVPAPCADRGATLLEASLDLLTLIADHQTEGMSRWFALLCEINISTNKPTSLRTLAKRVLKTLCGGNKALYHSVRDHFAFGFQLRTLYRNASTALEAALIVKEKARQCSDDWSTINELNWSNLAAGDLIGTEELVSEDSYTQLSSKKLGKVLDELWSVIKNRGESWRRFCGLQSLPHSHRENIGSRSELGEGELHLSASAPIVALFWMASTLTGANQVKLFRLVDFALTNWKERKSGQGKSHDSSSEDDGGQEETAGEESLPLASQPSSLPEDVLIRGDRKLTTEAIVGFAMASVYRGRTVELRRVAYHVLVKLCDRLSSSERGLVLQRLIGSPLVNLGTMGKTCVEFLHLAQSLCRTLDSSLPVKEAANFIMRCFVEQMTSVKYDRSNGEWFIFDAGSGASASKKKFDLAECGYCVRAHHFGTKEGGHKTNDRRENTSRVPRSGGGGGGNSGSPRASSSSSSRNQPARKWNPEQICNFARSHLDSVKDASASNEFCSFFTLKNRVVISDIDLTVNDPRGRYVKTVTVFSSPRRVEDVSELKSDRFAVKWQRCATLSLTRGATRASTSLSHLMLAANLKVEFSEFYERPGGSKASDGSLLVHCPRCTRVVTNAHGVCGNCGEVAFQCRKCRHINYDRLDAFLCVECGYCASGSFSFELNCGVASNAIAITNDEDFEGATKMLTTTKAIHGELKETLREKLRAANTRKKSGGKKDDSSASLFSQALQRAFRGLPPKPPPVVASEDGESYLSRIDQQGSVVKFVARPESVQSGGRASTAVDRTRSLLRLARQIRSESSSASDRRRGPSDVIIRHLGRGLAIDNLDDENDLIGLLEGGSVLDSSEPLSRVIASVQSRRRAESGRSSGQNRRTESSGSTRKNESGKEVLEECQRLHMLMREAERECSELGRRIEAWNRLDSGSIVETKSSGPNPSMNYSPSHCSSCGAAVALQLLLLWSRLFAADPNSVDVDPRFLFVLFEEVPNASRALMDCKRQVVQEIATKSRSGAKLVLAELSKRLSATDDMASADILGKILEVEGFEMSEDYTKLAMDVLATRRGV